LEREHQKTAAGAVFHRAAANSVALAVAEDLAASAVVAAEALEEEALREDGEQLTISN
jgi:hypothetical protein